MLWALVKPIIILDMGDSIFGISWKRGKRRGRMVYRFLPGVEAGTKAYDHNLCLTSMG